jgi:hypothetical protein
MIFLELGPASGRKEGLGGAHGYLMELAQGLHHVCQALLLPILGCIAVAMVSVYSGADSFSDIQAWEPEYLLHSLCHQPLESPHGPHCTPAGGALHRGRGVGFTQVSGNSAPGPTSK